MPLGTLDRTAPPLFNQGPSALSKLIFFSARNVLRRFDLSGQVNQL